MRGWTFAGLAGVLMLSACASEEDAVVPYAAAAEPGASTYVVRDTMITAERELTGVAEPFRQATLSTKVMGTVTAVQVREGDRVTAGTPLLRIDARELDAKRAQVAAGIAAAEAMQREAELMAKRMRALFADSAAPKAQFDAAEAGLARANAGVAAARAGEAELEAVASYAVVRSPFDGVVTQRMVDPGAFAAPGVPLLVVQQQSRLRITATAAPADVRMLRRGARVRATVEGIAASGVVEGIVPSAAALRTVNVVVENRDGRLAPGGAATVVVHEGTRRATLVPARALLREGDLVGVRVRGKEQRAPASVRWVRIGRHVGPFVEVLAGLEAGDVVLVPASREARR